MEFPSEEMELATQDVREMTEKEDDINLDFSKLSKKLQTVRAHSFRSADRRTGGRLEGPS